MNPEQEIAQLKRKVEELEKYVKERKVQQIIDPLDERSRKILNKYFLSIVTQFTSTGVGSTEFQNYIIKQDNKGYRAVSELPIYTFAANSSTDTLEIGTNVITGEQGSYPNDTQIVVFANFTGTLPSPLSSALTYYVVGASGNNIQLSATLGGAAINLTDAGTGEFYIQQF